MPLRPGRDAPLRRFAARLGFGPVGHWPRVAGAGRAAVGHGHRRAGLAAAGRRRPAGPRRARIGGGIWKELPRGPRGDYLLLCRGTSLAILQGCPPRSLPPEPSARTPLQKAGRDAPGGPAWSPTSQPWRPASGRPGRPSQSLGAAGSGGFPAFARGAERALRTRRCRSCRARRAARNARARGDRGCRGEHGPRVARVAQGTRVVQAARGAGCGGRARQSHVSWRPVRAGLGRRVHRTRPEGSLFRSISTRSMHLPLLFALAACLKEASASFPLKLPGLYG